VLTSSKFHMRNAALFGVALSIAAAAAGQAKDASGVAPIVMSLPDSNPYACKADRAPQFVTHDFPSGVEARMTGFAAVRLDGAGKVEEVDLVHDPIPSLAAQERESLQRWNYSAPKKGGASVPGWATVSLDFQFEYSRPQVTKISFAKIEAGDPMPVPLKGDWTEAWLAKAPAPSDLKGAQPAESLDAPVQARKTRWSADRYRGTFPVTLWLEISPEGRVSRIVPVTLADPAVLPYLRRALARWTFTPAAEGGKAKACWGVLKIEGTISYDVSLKGAASVKKTVGPD